MVLMGRGPLNFLLILFTVSLQAVAKPPKLSPPLDTFGRAVQAYKNQSYVKCIEEVASLPESSLGIKELSLKAQCELGTQRNEAVLTTARRYLLSKYPWWRDFEFSKNENTPPWSQVEQADLQLVWVIGAAYAQQYNEAPGDRVTREMKAKKEQVEKIYQGLLETNFDAERAESLNNPIQAKEETLKRQKQSRRWSAAFLYSRFSTHFDFDSPGVSGKGLGSLLGFHLGATWKNYFRQWSLGLKGGLLNSNFQDQASGQFFAGGKGYFGGASVQYLKNLHESGSALGLELSVLGLQMLATLPAVGQIRALNLEVIPTVVYRAGFYSVVYVDFKYGRPLREGSGFWMVELGREL